MLMKTSQQLQYRLLQKEYDECSMLRKYIEFRERQFYERDANRTSLPFEWGTELVGVQANGDPYEALRSFAAEALRSSDKFFDFEPVSEYTLKDGLLKFRSPAETPFPENNTVY